MKSASFTERPQADGTKFVVYKFITDADEVYIEIQLRPVSYDPNADLASNASRWDQLLIDAEINANMEEIVGG